MDTHGESFDWDGPVVDGATLRQMERYMPSTSKSDTSHLPVSRIARAIGVSPTTWLTVLLLGTLAVDPALAQDSTAAFCDTAMADTIRNIFTIIMLGGPLVGGVIALGATVVLPAVRRSDMKLELKEMRNQGLLWGVIVAPLGTAMVGFLLNNVVVGGSGCGF